MDSIFDLDDDELEKVVGGDGIGMLGGGGRSDPPATGAESTTARPGGTISLSGG